MTSFQFSIRSLLLSIVIIATPVAFIARLYRKASDTETLLAMLSHNSDEAVLDYEVRQSDPLGPWGDTRSSSWWRNLTGLQYCGNIAGVCLSVETAKKVLPEIAYSPHVKMIAVVGRGAPHAHDIDDATINLLTTFPHLSDITLIDVKCQSLSFLSKCKTLTRLSFYGVDSCADDIDIICSLNGLKVVWLYDTSILTSRYDDIRRNNPSVTINGK